MYIIGLQLFYIPFHSIYLCNWSVDFDYMAWVNTSKEGSICVCIVFLATWLLDESRRLECLSLIRLFRKALLSLSLISFLFW